MFGPATRFAGNSSRLKPRVCSLQIAPSLSSRGDKDKEKSKAWPKAQTHQQHNRRSPIFSASTSRKSQDTAPLRMESSLPWALERSPSLPCKLRLAGGRAFSDGCAVQGGKVADSPGGRETASTRLTGSSNRNLEVVLGRLFVSSCSGNVSTRFRFARITATWNTRRSSSRSSAL